ncbi:MAG: hypothetical protein II306_04800 [Clostridia bacterium]|nr:hypothetical protein [Clostridia bacterium]MEE1024404.1 hypothetical protein [Acutalibacteraceae bacterium]
MKKIVIALLAIVMLFSMSVVSFAEPSPTAPSVSVENKEFNCAGGSIDISIDTVAKTATLVADEKTDFDFAGWIIPEDYEIVEGSTESEKIVVSYTCEPDEIEITAKYVSKDGTTTYTVSTQGKVTSNVAESPATGDVVYAVAALMMLAAASVAVVAAKKAIA